MESEERISVGELAKAVQAMRNAQKKYFSLRTGQALSDARLAEQHVDRLLKDILDPSLFPRD